MRTRGPLSDGVLEDVTQPLLVGFSGGLDSSVLLHALADSADVRARGLRAVHVHHGLHPDADAWAAHCEHVCATLDILLVVMRVRVQWDGGGPEASARAARMHAFEDALRDGEVLVLAHHQDDQAETFLLRALRGSGVEGLRAMRHWRRFGRGWLWRPLLDVPRSALLEYAQRHRLDWIDDPSNADTRLDRNFVRHRILPLLRERWPHADATLARSAALQAEAATLLAAEDIHLLQVARAGSADTLDLRVLSGWPAARRARVLRRWIDRLGLPPLPAQGIACFETELLTAPRDATPAFVWSGARLCRWRDLLHAGWRQASLPPAWNAVWDGREPLALPGGGLLALEGVAAFRVPLHAHVRRGGERITLPGRSHTHSLKHVLQDRDVPPWRRERLPLLSDASGRVVAAADIAFDAAFAGWLEERDARLVWMPDAEVPVGSAPPAA
jgi:tRNA(Ile)-lysidine synthase